MQRKVIVVMTTTPTFQFSAQQLSNESSSIHKALKWNKQLASSKVFFSSFIYLLITIYYFII